MIEELSWNKVIHDPSSGINTINADIFQLKDIDEYKKVNEVFYLLSYINLRPECGHEARLMNTKSVYIIG